MKVIHLNYLISEGNAGGAVWRIHKNLLKLGVDSYCFCLEKKRTDPRVLTMNSRPLKLLKTKVFPFIEKAVARFFQPHEDVHSINFLPTFFVDYIKAQKPDIIHVHWIGKGMLRIEDIAKFGCPVVWSCHDQWPFLGAEHYANISDAYERAYKVLGCSRRGVNINSINFKRKEKAYGQVPMKYIGISNWVSDCARKNYFIREQDVRTVLYSVEREIYRPLSRVYSRDLFGMNSDEYVVLFGANTLKNKRKGFDLLLEALEALPETINGKPVRAFLFGPRLAFDYKGKVPIEHAGYISDARMLAILYNAVDVMVTPSRQEAFGMTCLEALACGTPVVAFAIGGFLDQIQDGQNGFLADPESPASLAKKLVAILSDDGKREQMGKRALEVASSKFREEREAEEYLELYGEMLKEDSSRGD